MVGIPYIVAVDIPETASLDTRLLVVDTVAASAQAA